MRLRACHYTGARAEAWCLLIHGEASLSLSFSSSVRSSSPALPPSIPTHGHQALVQPGLPRGAENRLLSAPPALLLMKCMRGRPHMQVSHDLDKHGYARRAHLPTRDLHSSNSRSDVSTLGVSMTKTA